MTREKAIKLLSNDAFKLCMVQLRDPLFEECYEALNMAIEALKQEPCEDCISRERLRESLKKELVIVNNNEMYWQGWHDCTVAVETRITDAPSVAPKCGKWIDKGDFYVCSECGKRMAYAVLGPEFSRAYAFMSDYCPHCGCPMEVESDTDIVRCKECKWRGHIGCAVQIVDESDRPNDNDFCSFGERRE